jgi:hypothetical protein
MAIALGMVTGIGGGMVRDVLLAEISNRTARRTLCGRGACRRRCRGDRAHATVTSRSGDGGSIDPLLLAPRDGDQARLAASGGEIQGSTRFECCKRRFKGSREILSAGCTR